MLRPWYRSRLFWLGVPGFAFLIWAWLGQLRHYWYLSFTQVDGPVSASTWALESYAGAVSLGWSSHSFGISGPSSVGWDWSKENLDADEPTIYHTEFPFGISYEPLGGYDYAWIDWWMLAALYATAWLVAQLAWRRRRRRMEGAPRRPGAEAPENREP